MKFSTSKGVKVVVVIAGVLVVLFAAFVGWIRFTTLQPDQVQSATVESTERAPPIPEGEEIKLLNWNVQFMAGKDYYFYYEGGSDERPSAEEFKKTTEEVARVVKDENPDIILLQEVDDGARRTDGEDQLQNLLELLPEEYSYHTSAFYWQAAFAPHPQIMGAVGMKLSVVSRYRIESATRHQLSLKPDNWFVRQFDLKRAVLEVRFPREDGKDFLLFNTHLTAFTYGSDVRERQVDEIQVLLEERSEGGFPWIIGGDFNLQPPGKDEKGSSRTGDSEGKSLIEPLFDSYRAIPGAEEVNGPDPEDWYTHFPNDPEITEPSKTIDYFFLSDKVAPGDHYVRQEDTSDISDHLPIVAEISVE